MSDLTPDDRALIDAARDGGAPTAADRARVQRRLAVQLGAAAVGLTATTTATSAAAGGWLSGLTATKVVLALTVIGGVGAGSAVAIRSHATRTPATVTVTTSTVAPGGPGRMSRTPATVAVPAPAPDSSEPPPEPSTTPPSVVAVAPHAKTATSSRPTPTPSPSPSPSAERRSTLDEEIAALAQADAAVRRGDGAAALAQLDEHARRYPKSAVREERQVERVLALCAAGRVDAARKEGEAILRARPSSPYLPRLRASCVFP